MGELTGYTAGGPVVTYPGLTGDAGSRAIRKYAWLASAFSVSFPRETSHVLEHLQVRSNEPSCRGAVKGAPVLSRKRRVKRQTKKGQEVVVSRVVCVSVKSLPSASSQRLSEDR